MAKLSIRIASRQLTISFYNLRGVESKDGVEEATILYCCGVSKYVICMMRCVYVCMIVGRDGGSWREGRKVRSICHRLIEELIYWAVKKMIL